MTPNDTQTLEVETDASPASKADSENTTSLLDSAAAAAKEFAAAEVKEKDDPNSDKADDTQTDDENTDQASEEDGDKPADEEDGFKPTAAQVRLAKQLRYSDEDIEKLDAAEFKVIDRVARKQSRLESERGKQKQLADKAKKATGDDAGDGEGAESSANAVDDFFNDDDWGTEAGTKKMNDIHAMLTQQSQSLQVQDEQSNEQIANQIDEAFDALDPEVFADFQPGESAYIEAGSPADVRREEAVTMALGIQEMRAAAGETISLVDAIDKALLVVADTETQAAARKALGKKQEQRGRQRISAPSSSGKTPKPVFKNREEQAAHAIVEQLHPTD